MAASEICSTMENPRGASQEAAYSTPVFTLLAPLPGTGCLVFLYHKDDYTVIITVITVIAVITVILLLLY